MNIIQTHSFKTLVTSRFVRILASTDVRWIGSAEKCFRFEIIGCDPEQIIPEINFEATSKPAGNFCLKLLRYVNVMYVINSKLRVETQSLCTKQIQNVNVLPTVSLILRLH